MIRKPLNAKKTNMAAWPMAIGSVNAWEKNTTVHATPRIPSSAGRRPRRCGEVTRSDMAQSYQTSLGGELQPTWERLVLRVGIA